MDQVIQNNPRERPFRKSPVRHVYLGSQGPLKPHNIDNLARHYGWSGSGAATNFYRILLPSSQTRRTDDGSLVAAKGAITYVDFDVTARNHLDGRHEPSPFVSLLSDRKNAVYYAAKVSDETETPLESIEIAEIYGDMLDHIYLFGATRVNSTLRLGVEPWKISQNAWLCLYGIPGYAVKTVYDSDAVVDMLDQYRIEDKARTAARGEPYQVYKGPSGKWTYSTTVGFADEEDQEAEPDQGNDSVNSHLLDWQRIEDESCRAQSLVAGMKVLTLND